MCREISWCGLWVCYVEGGGNGIGGCLSAGSFRVNNFSETARKSWLYLDKGWTNSTTRRNVPVFIDLQYIDTYICVYYFQLFSRISTYWATKGCEQGCHQPTVAAFYSSGGSFVLGGVWPRKVREGWRDKDDFDGFLELKLKFSLAVSIPGCHGIMIGPIDGFRWVVMCPPFAEVGTPWGVPGVWHRWRCWSSYLGPWEIHRRCRAIPSPIRRTSIF